MRLHSGIALLRLVFGKPFSVSFFQVIMTYLSYYENLSSLAFSQEIEKCSALCDGGEIKLADCDGNDECYTSCNNEKCDVYEKTILLNPHLNENLVGWYCRGGCIMAEIDEGYDQAGVLVLGRSAPWNGFAQDVSGLEFQDTNYRGKCFIRSGFYCYTFQLLELMFK